MPLRGFNFCLKLLRCDSEGVFIKFASMKVYVITMTVDYEGAVALGAFTDKEKAFEALRNDVADNFEDGYEVVEEGGENFSYVCLKYYRLECDDEDSPTLFYSLSEMDLN
jgi:hypothetical protein